jgi:hypothetical protein
MRSDGPDCGVQKNSCRLATVIIGRTVGVKQAVRGARRRGCLEWPPSRFGAAEVRDAS